MASQLTRKEFLAKVSELTGKAPATISQFIYTIKYKPNQRKLEGHVVRPYFSQDQVKDLALKMKEFSDD